MILKRQEKDNLIKAMYNSTNIIASIYDKSTNDLTLIFNKGSQYKYPKVSLTDYTRFELAESQGKVFNSHIKTYAFEKLTDINPEAILKEVTEMNNAEQKALLQAKQKSLVNNMKQLITIDERGEEISEIQLEELTEKIKNYLTTYNK